MSRSLLISEITPWLVHQLHQQGHSFTPEEIQEQLSTLNEDNDPGHEFHHILDFHQHEGDSDHVETSGEEGHIVCSCGLDSYEEISDFEFFKNKKNLAGPLRRNVKILIQKNYDFFSAGDYLILENGDGLVGTEDFVFDKRQPETWKVNSIALSFFADLYDRPEENNISGSEISFETFFGANFLELILKKRGNEEPSLSESARIIQAIPNKEEATDDQVEYIRQTTDRLLARFEEAKNNGDAFELQNLFIQLMVVIEKGWAPNFFSVLADLTDEQWTQIFDHPTLPLKAARVFAKALEFYGDDGLEQEFEAISQRSQLPFPFLLLVASARGHQLVNKGQDPDSWTLSWMRDAFYIALDTNQKIHPAYRLIALEALGKLTIRNLVGEEDSDKLMGFLRNYRSPTEEDLKELLTPAQYDRSVKQHQMQMMKGELELEETDRSDESYSVSGVLTYWLMDYNHQIVERTYFVLSAINEPDKVSHAIWDFMKRDRNQDPDIPKSSSYVEYYKVVEAVNALGRIYRKEGWVDIAFNLHQNNQIGREFERNPEFTQQIMAAFQIDGDQLMESWDNEEQLLTKNYLALQIGRYFYEKEDPSQSIKSWWNTNSNQQWVIDYDFNNKGPEDLEALRVFMDENSDALKEIVDNIDPQFKLGATNFQQWQNWQHFGPFIYDELEAQKLALKADILRKAWSWEFFQLRPEEFTDPALVRPENQKEIILTLLTHLQKNPFAYLRPDLVIPFLSHSDPEVRREAYLALRDMKLPEDWVQEEMALALGQDPRSDYKRGDLLKLEENKDVRKAMRQALKRSTTKKAGRAHYPDERKRKLEEPLVFDNKRARYTTVKQWFDKRDKIEHPKNSKPHAYQRILRTLAKDYGEETVEYLVYLLEHPAEIEPGNRKFRYIADRIDPVSFYGVIAVLADLIFTDKRLQELFKGLFLHASSATNPLLTRFLREWGKRNQATLIELLREFHLTYEPIDPVTGEEIDPLDHFAKIAFKFVRDQFILAALRGGLNDDVDPFVALTEQKEQVEKEIQGLTNGEDVETFKRQSEVEIRRLQFLRMEPGEESFRLITLQITEIEEKLDRLEMLLEERRSWIDHEVDVLF